MSLTGVAKAVAMIVANARNVGFIVAVGLDEAAVMVVKTLRAFMSGFMLCLRFCGRPGCLTTGWTLLPHANHARPHQVSNAIRVVLS